MTKSDDDEPKEHEEPTASAEDPVALSTRDVELEPVSLRDIEMILAPGKLPPPMSLAQKEASARGAKGAGAKAPSVPPHRPPVKVRVGKSDAPPPIPKAPRVPSQAAPLPPPKKLEPRKLPAPAARKEESATVDLAALLSGSPKSSRPPTAPTNADVVIGAPRAPKPVPKPPLKRASVPDDGPVALPSLEAKPSDASELPVVDGRESEEEVAAAKAPPDDADIDVQPEGEVAATAPRADDDEPTPEDKPAKVVPKPPRKKASATATKVEAVDDDAKEREPRPSSRPRRSSAPATTKSTAPRSVAPAAPAPEEKRSRTGVFAAAAVLCGGLVVFAVTRGGEEPAAKPTPTATAARESTATTAPVTPTTSAQTPPAPTTTAEPSASVEAVPSTTSTATSTTTTTATTPPTGTIPIPTATSPTTTAPPTATATQTTPAATAPFDKAAANAALGAGVGRAAGCKKPGDPSGVAKVSVTFSTSGRVTQAMVNGPPFAGTPTGGCIANAFRSASVPPFTGDKVTVQKTVNIP